MLLQIHYVISRTRKTLKVIGSCMKGNCADANNDFVECLLNYTEVNLVIPAYVWDVRSALEVILKLRCQVHF